MECVFAFLPLSSLAAACRVAREWRAAVASMRSIECTIVVKRERRNRLPDELWHSVLFRHVAHIRRAALLTLPALHEVAKRCPQLRTLDVQLLLRSIDDASIVFPKQLRELKVDTKQKEHALAEREELAQRILDAVAQLPQLKVLTLGPTFRHCSLKPLHALQATLRRFDIEFRPSAEDLRALPLEEGNFNLDLATARSNIEVLRALPHLERAVVCPPEAVGTFLTDLLRLPHELQWQDLGKISTQRHYRCSATAASDADHSHDKRLP